jgi:hypothetical protein
MISKNTQPRDPGEFMYADKILVRSTFIEIYLDMDRFYQKMIHEGKQDKEIYLLLDDMANKLAVTLHEIDKKEYT